MPSLVDVYVQPFLLGDDEGGNERKGRLGDMQRQEVSMLCALPCLRMKVSRENYIRGARMRKVGAPECVASALLCCLR